MPGYQSTLVEAQGDGTALTNTTTGASILPSAARLLLPGGFLNRPGKMLHIMAAGRISTVVTTPGTLTFEVRMGPASAIIAATSPAFALNVVAKTNVSWYLDWLLTLRAVGTGTSANWMHQGTWTSEAVIGAPLPSVGGAGTHMIPASAPAVGTGFDSTIANILDLQADWSVANAANSIQLHMYKLVALNME